MRSDSTDTRAATTCCACHPLTATFILRGFKQRLHLLLPVADPAPVAFAVSWRCTKRAGLSALKPSRTLSFFPRASEPSAANDGSSGEVMRRAQAGRRASCQETRRVCSALKETSGSEDEVTDAEGDEIDGCDDGLGMAAHV